MLRRFPRILTTILVQLIALKVCLASEGLDIPEGLDNQVNLTGLTGISLFFARTYNENLLLYAIICTVLMAALGIAIAFVTDIGLKAMGMETEKIEHKE